MRLLVGVKRVVDYAVPIRIKPDKLTIEGVIPKFSMNPFDEIALEEAVRLKEQGLAKEVLAVSIGPQQAQDTLRTALALGADRALHIPTTGGVEPLVVARLLAGVVGREQPGLVLLGKQAIDDDANQTGQLLAGLLGWPQGTFASKVQLQKGPGGPAGAHQGATVQVTREVDGGLQVVCLGLPAVVTADLRLNTPRFVTLPATMRAKKKAIESLSPQELDVDITPQLQVLQVDEPPKRKTGVIVKSAGELMQKLHAAGLL